MATEERSLGNIEGRMAEQSALLHQLHADLTSGLQRVNADLTYGLQQVNGRIDRLMLAMMAIGGGLVAALVGVIITLIIQGG